VKKEMYPYCHFGEYSTLHMRAALLIQIGNGIHIFIKRADNGSYEMIARVNLYVLQINY